MTTRIHEAAGDHHGRHAGHGRCDGYPPVTPGGRGLACDVTRHGLVHVPFLGKGASLFFGFNRRP
jgi:hypothetical protein